MSTLRVPIRVVFYRDDDSWVAHCLEFNLIGDGETQDEALAQLSVAIQIQVEATRDFGNPANLFSPAEGQYFRMFAAGDDVTVADMEFDLGQAAGIAIDSVQVREFVEPEPAAV